MSTARTTRTALGGGIVGPALAAPLPDWEERLAALWWLLDELPEDDFLNRMTALTAELGAEHAAVRHFELGAAYDAVGRTVDAVVLYRRALAAGLTGTRHQRAVIQMASGLRMLGRIWEDAALLTAEPDGAGDDFLALVLADMLRIVHADTALAAEEAAR